MKIGLSFAVEFCHQIKNLKFFVVFNHSGKVPSGNELLKSIETIGEIRDLKFYILIQEYS